MKDFHCEVFELSFRFTAEEMEQDKFLEATGIEDREEVTDEDGEIFITNTFGHREETTDYHAHIRVLIDKEGKGRVDLRYHESSLDIEDEKPPHAEDVASWLADFFKSEEVKARITTGYTFDSSYAPTIALPFPLATSEKALAGSSVVGISIQFPEKHPLDLAIVQRGEKSTIVSALLTSMLRLRDFDLLAELKRLEVYIDSLVRKQEPSDETESVGKEE